MAISAVSNAGPLMVFSKLNILYLLKELYGQVEVPLSVYRETGELGTTSNIQITLGGHLWRSALVRQKHGSSFLGKHYNYARGGPEPE